MKVKILVIFFLFNFLGNAYSNESTSSSLGNLDMYLTSCGEDKEPDFKNFSRYFLKSYGNYLWNDMFIAFQLSFVSKYFESQPLQLISMFYAALAQYFVYQTKPNNEVVLNLKNTDNEETISMDLLHELNKMISARTFFNHMMMVLLKEPRAISCLKERKDMSQRNYFKFLFYSVAFTYIIKRL